MSIFHDSALLGASSSQSYQIERSLRFNGSVDSTYLNRTPASAGNRKTWSVSLWLKRSALGTYQMPFSCYQSTGGALALIFNTDNTLEFYQYNAAYQMRLITSQVFRDVSAWYHLIFSVDTTQATSSNRVKIYLNGVQITAFNTATYPNQNEDLIFNYAQAHAIGMYASNNQYYFDGLITEFHNVDGQALTPSSFGETDTITGVWKPKKYSGTYSGNSFFLKFADNSGTTSTTLGKDSSGLGNNWTPNNFSVTAGSGNDSLIDTPTPYADGGNGRGNYCTLNPLDNPNTTYALAQNGCLEANLGTGVGTFLAGTVSTLGGKYYWEFTPTTIGNGLSLGITYGTTTTVDANNKAIFYAFNGNKRILGGADTAYGSSYAANDVIGVAVNSIAGTIEFFKNNTSQGVITDSSISLQPFRPFVFNNSSSANSYTICNFGQRAFAYTPPSGFLALNTQNLPEPSIKKPSSYMDTVLWTGNGAAGRSITGLNFSPDLVWLKNRSDTYAHQLHDAVRGASAGALYSNLTNAQDPNFPLTSFDSAGFTLGNTASLAAQSQGSQNYNGNGFVAWCWDESATPGFDIVTYTGTGVSRTIAHSLGVAPAMMIVKKRNSASSSAWCVYHRGLPAPSTDFLRLDLTNASDTAATVFGAVPTSSVFTVGTDAATNANADTFVAYLWSEVAGFSKFGSYTGNGSADGPFVYCGFRPRWVMIKSSTNASTPWQIFDSARESGNTIEQTLVANGPNAEPYDTASPVDFLSNGFKIRSGPSGYNNYNTGTWIFAAFAETPMKYSLAY